MIKAAPAFFSWYARIVAVLSLLAWFSGSIDDWLVRVDRFGVVYALGWWPSLPFAALMLLLSVGLRRRKRSARRIMLAVLGVVLARTALFLVILLSLTPDERRLVGWPDVVALLAVPSVLVVAQIAWLVAARREFPALPDPADRKLAAAVFTACLLVLVGLGGTVVAGNDTGAAGPVWQDVAYSLLQTVFGPRITGEALGVSVPAWVDLLLGVLGSGLLLVTVWALFRPARAGGGLSADQELEARRLLARYGEDDSLGYFALRDDKETATAPSGRAAIAYRRVGPVCLAAGDPIGDPGAWPEAIRSWLERCRAHAWTPGVLGAGERAAAAYGREGLNVLELGDEAVLDLASFTLDGRGMRPVRQAVRRVRRAGYTARVRRCRDIPADEMADLIVLADRWRDGETERGFSMALGRLGDPRDGACAVVEAFGPDGRLRGMLGFVPWGRSGLSLDLMRRDPGAENGVNEFMVAALAEDAGSLGVRRLSLNFAVLRGIFERGARIGAGPVLRAAYRVLSLASRFWQLESLYQANAKYRPEWVPRLVCYRRPGDLASVAVAAARAEGFLPDLRAPRARAKGPSPALLEGIARIEREADAERLPRRRLSEQERVRHAKLDALRAQGRDPYPVGFAPTDTAAGLAAEFAGLAPGTATGRAAAVAGRVVAVRDHGGVGFAVLRDATGDVQVMLARDAAGDFGGWKRLVDLGDQVVVEGEVVATRAGELTVAAGSWTMTAKCLRPPPRTRDAAARARRRHLDLIVDPRARRMLRMRGDAVAAVRDALRERGFLEVETPMLQPVHGGAAARPFVTHMNAVDADMYLRIAPELYLKRLLVGGAGKVFELNRNFRNEGTSPRHNPEFTMLEAYEPYGDYDTVAALIRDLVVSAARAALGTTVVERDGIEYDLAEPWREVTVYGAVSEAVGHEVTTDTPLERVRTLAEAHGVAPRPEWGQGRLVQEMFEALVEEELVAPTFVRDYPTETSPLARGHRGDPRLAEKWDLIVFGLELGTGYTELNDPVEQRQRLTAQSLLAAGGDPEAMRLDEDFLQAMEYGMPPAGGLGMGIDRLLITLTGRTIRDTIAFPPVRPIDP
ncbi:bifunctional lysylphosphatidylglycerol synthetase/lysine--tRNA ligase LysX [Nocardiopsis baichengensis]|uniref:bifunctional lysylphosphatidylglycerol synthetase/lysine--tRNA ligase LysX n=1 Tax=Nocardiopsis baichengensis TaxID=280240 RepID=UPI00034672FA|nr:bifunctional lysylphosphatidylglycerol synthetase/lysine--tRNA ligase LysX [Nocardiopsis baichengensis]